MSVDDLKSQLRAKGWDEELGEGVWSHWTHPNETESFEGALAIEGIARVPAASTEEKECVEWAYTYKLHGYDVTVQATDDDQYDQAGWDVLVSGPLTFDRWRRISLQQRRPSEGFVDELVKRWVNEETDKRIEMERRGITVLPPSPVEPEDVAGLPLSEPLALRLTREGAAWEPPEWVKRGVAAGLIEPPTKKPNPNPAPAGATDLARRLKF